MGSARMSRRGDLIVRINLERSRQGMEYSEVVGLSGKLCRLKADDLQRLYKELLAKRDVNGERKDEQGERKQGEPRRPEAGRSAVAQVEGQGKAVCVQ